MQQVSLSCSSDELLKAQHYPDTRRFSETPLNVTSIEDVGTAADETGTVVSCITLTLQ